MLRPVSVVLLVVLAVLGTWFAAPRLRPDEFLDRTVFLLLQDVEQARNDLERAGKMGSPERRAEALAVAQGSLRSAMWASDLISRHIAPQRQERFEPYGAIMTNTNGLLRFCAELTPEMTAEELKRRVEMLTGLHSAIATAVDARDQSVDRGRLTEAWYGYLKTFEKPRQGFPPFFSLPEPPIPATVTPKWAPDRRSLELTLAWERSYRVFPRPQQHFVVLYIQGAARVAEVTSTAGKQNTLAAEMSLEPFTMQPSPEAFLQPFGLPGAREMRADAVTLVGALEGLPQTLTVRFTEPVSALEIFFLQHRGGEYRQSVQVTQNTASEFR